MKALLWKEARELAWPFGMFLALFAALAVVAAVWPGKKDDTVGLFVVPWMVWWVLSPFLAALWGAHPLARERSHGTLEWFGALPVSRARVWAVKLVVSLVALAILCAAMFALCWLVGTMASHKFDADDLEADEATLAAGVLFFCVGLAIGGTRRHTFESVLVTILAFLLLAGGWIFLAGDFLPRFWGPQLGIIYSVPQITTLWWLALVLAVAFLTASARGWISIPLLAFGRRYWRTAGWAAGLVVVGLAGLIVGVRYFGVPQPRQLSNLQSAQTSPDGNWIAFTDVRQGGDSPQRDASLWIMRADGTGVRCLARGPVQRFLWEPDSRRILLVWGDPGLYAPLLPAAMLWAWDVQVADGRLRFLMDAPGHWNQLSVSPRGQYAWWNHHVLRLGPHPGLLPPETAGSFTFWTWAPDDSGFFFNSAGGMGFLALPSGKVSSLGPVPPGTNYLSVSPDGQWLAYEIKAPDQRGRDQGTTVLTRRGQLGGLCFPSIPWRGQPWSPDGRYLWLDDWLGDPLVIVDMTGPRVLREIPAPWGGAHAAPWYVLGWSPDGQRVAFMTGGDVKTLPVVHEVVWTARADGSGLRQLAQATSVYAANEMSFQPSWTRDGKIIVRLNPTTLAALDPDTGQEKDLLVVPTEAQP